MTIEYLQRYLETDVKFQNDHKIPSLGLMSNLKYDHIIPTGGLFVGHSTPRFPKISVFDKVGTGHMTPTLIDELDHIQ